MAESTLIQLATAILFLPLLGFTVALFFGKRFKPAYWFEIFTVGLGLVFAIVLGVTGNLINSV